MNIRVFESICSSTFSPSATSHIFSSVTGSIVAKVFLLTESTYSSLIKSCQYIRKKAIEMSGTF